MFFLIGTFSLSHCVRVCTLFLIDTFSLSHYVRVGTSTFYFVDWYILFISSRYPAGVFLYGHICCSYMVVHIWLFIYGCLYMGISHSL